MVELAKDAGLALRACLVYTSFMENVKPKRVMVINKGRNIIAQLLAMSPALAQIDLRAKEPTIKERKPDEKE